MHGSERTSMRRTIPVHLSFIWPAISGLGILLGLGLLFFFDAKDGEEAQKNQFVSAMILLGILAGLYMLLHKIRNPRVELYPEERCIRHHRLFFPPKTYLCNSFSRVSQGSDTHGQISIHLEFSNGTITLDEYGGWQAVLEFIEQCNLSERVY